MKSLNILLFLSMVSLSMAQRTKEDIYPRKQLSLPEMITRFRSNVSDDTVYFHAIPAELYYNDTIQSPIQDFKQLLNISGLNSEEIQVVLAFPYFPSEDKTKEQLTDNMTTDESKDVETEPQFDLEAIPEITKNDEFSARGLRSVEPQNRFSFFNPMTWFRPQTTTTTTAPPVINNFFVRPNQVEPLQPQVKPLQTPVVYTPPPIQSLNKLSDVGSAGNPLGTKVGTPILTTRDQLQNVQFSGLAMNYPLYPLVPANRIITDSQPKPEYPSTGNRPSVMEVVYS